MKIDKLTVNEFSDGLENIITYVHWEVNGLRGTTKLNPPRKVFKPLEEVSEEDIIGWVYRDDAKKIARLKAKSKSINVQTSVGEVPEPSAEALEAKKEYWINWAINKLAQYEVAIGRPELKEMQPTGEQVFNEETGEMEDVMQEVVVQTAIDPVEPTVEVTVYGDDIDAEPTVEIIENPLITTDKAERLKAESILKEYDYVG